MLVAEDGNLWLREYQLRSDPDATRVILSEDGTPLAELQTFPDFEPMYIGRAVVIGVRRGPEDQEYVAPTSCAAASSGAPRRRKAWPRYGIAQHTRHARRGARIRATFTSFRRGHRYKHAAGHRSVLRSRRPGAVIVTRAPRFTDPCYLHVVPAWSSLQACRSAPIRATFTSLRRGYRDTRAAGHRSVLPSRRSGAVIVTRAPRGTDPCYLHVAPARSS
jgi:hypothetical protein